MLKALEVAKDGWNELGRDSVGASTKIGEYIRVCQVFRDESINVYVSKNRVMSRHSGQHHDVPESYICNVTTFEPNLVMLQRGLLFNVGTLNPMLQCSKEVFF